MSSSDEQERTLRPWFAVALFCFGAFFVVFSKDITQTGLGGNDDPGPRFFPLVLGSGLLLGGVYELLVWAWRAQQRGGGPGLPVSAPVEAAVVNRVNVLLVVVALVIYIAAINYLGFSISTTLFASCLLIRFHTRWWKAVAAALALVIAIKLLFSLLFHVQLPEGFF